MEYLKANAWLVPVLTAGTLLIPVVTHAAVVYEGGGPNLANGLQADATTNETQAAQLISLTTSTIANGINWWGSYIPNGGTASADSFTLNIYQDSSGSVGSLVDTISLGSGSGTPTGRNLSSGYAEISYSSSFSAINLASGSYFIGLSDAHTGSSKWLWETTSGGQQLGAAQLFNGSWNYTSVENLALELTNTPVPLPASAWLMLSGIVGLGGIVRKRRTA